VERKRITCPESAHLEEVECERTACGLVVIGCSRFSPRSAVACTRECTRRLDRKERIADASDHVLVAYAHGAALRGDATTLAELLRRDGFAVEIADLDTWAGPPPQDYDAVVLGTPQRLARHARSGVRYAREHRDALAAMPAYWVGFGQRAAVAPEAMRAATGWRPARSFAVVLGGASDVRPVALAIADAIPPHEPPERTA